MLDTKQTQTFQQPEYIPPELNPEMTPGEALHLMAQDYLDSRHGRVKTDVEGAHTEEQLAELRRSIAAFAVFHDIDIADAAKKIGMSPEQLEEDLHRDEVLSQLTDEYTQRAQQEALGFIDRNEVQRVQLPSMSGVEALAAFSRLGFEEVRRRGTHATLQRTNEDGSVTTFPLPVGQHGDISPGLLRSIITKQARLSLADFVNAL